MLRCVTRVHLCCVARVHLRCVTRVHRHLRCVTRIHPPSFLAEVMPSSFRTTPTEHFTPLFWGLFRTEFGLLILKRHKNALKHVMSDRHIKKESIRNAQVRLPTTEV